MHINKWLKENAISQERMSINSIDYLFATMQDGWIAIFERDRNGAYSPLIQAMNREKALSYCAMREPVRVPMEKIASNTHN